MEHVPVMLSECIEGLRIRPDGVYVDGTVGRGGHSLEIAKRLDTGRLYCIDRDETAIAEAGEKLKPYKDKIVFIHGNFRDMARLLSETGVESVDGILLDLGVSSPQLDDGSRGFSYMQDAPLDMRMDKSSPFSAYELVNQTGEQELKRILYEYGEERYAPRIAAAIVRARENSPIKTTGELTEIIRSAMPGAALREKQHPAKRSFQAIRIAVNDELSSLSDLMDDAADCLSKGGRLCVISFHSLEDRIVKTAMNSKERGCTCPKEFPVCVCGFKQTMKVLTRKPVTPTEDELKRNPRSRSAKLRIAERI